MNVPTPMRILDWQQSDRALILAVDGYQFPGNKSLQYDNEWLMPSGSVRCEDAEWIFRDPWLMSSELVHFASALETGAGPHAAEEDLFIEPCLHVSWVKPGHVRVVFRPECAPPWKLEEPVEGAPSGWGYPPVFDVSAELASATPNALRDAAAKFPPHV